MRQPSKDVIAHYVYAKYSRIDREYIARRCAPPCGKSIPPKWPSMKRQDAKSSEQLSALSLPLSLGGELLLLATQLLPQTTHPWLFRSFPCAL